MKHDIGYAFASIMKFQTLLAFGFSALLLTGCGTKKEADTTQDTNTLSQAAKDSDPSAPPPLVAPKIFSDAKKQADFEKLFYICNDAFVPPPAGTPVRIMKKNGLRVDGEMMRFTADGIVISTPDGPLTVRRDEMSEETKESLFVDHFSRLMAEQKVNLGLTAAATLTPQDIFLDTDSTEVQEVRRFTADRMNTRLGPGRHFAPIASTELFRGQSVFVVDETNGWVCLKPSANENEVIGWVPKYATFVTNPEDKAVINREVDKLIESGFIIDVNPAKNEVLVDLYEWRISDSASAEGKSRLLAYYCGHQKGSRLFWVDIKDALSGKRLAEYSESKGFRVH